MFDVVPDDLVLSAFKPSFSRRNSCSLDFVDITSTAVYDSTASTQPGTMVDQYTEFPDQEMVPVIVEEELVANVNIELGVFFDTADDGTNRAFFNNITYRTVRRTA